MEEYLEIHNFVIPKRGCLTKNRMETRGSVLHSAFAFGRKHHSSRVLVIVRKTEQAAIHHIIRPQLTAHYLDHCTQWNM